MMKKKEWKKMHREGGGMVYVLGFFGSLVYFLQHATTLWEGVLGLLKSLVWPAVVIYKLLEFFRM